MQQDAFFSFQADATLSYGNAVVLTIVQQLFYISICWGVPQSGQRPWTDGAAANRGRSSQVSI